MIQDITGIIAICVWLEHLIHYLNLRSTILAATHSVEVNMTFLKYDDLDWEFKLEPINMNNTDFMNVSETAQVLHQHLHYSFLSLWPWRPSLRLRFVQDVCWAFSIFFVQVLVIYTCIFHQRNKLCWFFDETGTVFCHGIEKILWYLGVASCEPTNCNLLINTYKWVTCVNLKMINHLPVSAYQTWPDKAVS